MLNSIQFESAESLNYEERSSILSKVKAKIPHPICQKYGCDLRPKSFIAFDNTFYEVVDVNDGYALVKDAWNGFYALCNDQMYDYYGEGYSLFLAEAQDVKESDLTFLHTSEYVFPELICDVLRR